MTALFLGEPQANRRQKRAPPSILSRRSKDSKTKGSKRPAFSPLWPECNRIGRATQGPALRAERFAPRLARGQPRRRGRRRLPNGAFPPRPPSLAQSPGRASSAEGQKRASDGARRLGKPKVRANGGGLKEKKRFFSCRFVSTPHGAGRANLMRSLLRAAPRPFFLTAWQNWGADGARLAAWRAWGEGRTTRSAFAARSNASYSPRSRLGFCKLRSQAQQFPKRHARRRRRRRRRRAAGCGARGRPSLAPRRILFFDALGLPPGHAHVLSADARAPAFSPFRFFSLIFLFSHRLFPPKPPLWATRAGAGGLACPARRQSWRVLARARPIGDRHKLPISQQRL